MEKLIDLLNQYEMPRSGIMFKSYDDYDGTFYGVDCDWKTEIAWSDSYICSKKFGFIERLVQKEKIDFSLIPNKIKEIGIPMKINGEIKYGFDSSDYYWLLMLLAISDTPIEDLISYLK